MKIARFLDKKDNRIALIAIVLGILLGGAFYFGRPKVVTVPVTQKPYEELVKEIVHTDQTKKQVTFTFDGGSGAQSGEAILATLKKHHLTGTFFLTGKFVEENPALVKQMVAEHHEVYNHTYDHPYLTSLSDEQIIDQLRKMEDVLAQTAGISSKPYFRAPYGDNDDRVRAVAAREGYQSVYWTTDALDWQESSGMMADQVKEKILTNLEPGGIFLMHLGDTITGAILDDLFTTIESWGYKIVSLTQGL